MKKKNFLLAISLSLVTVVIVVIVLQWRSAVETPPISIPSPSVSPGGDSLNSGDDLLEVNVDTVQALISFLERPDSYARKYTVTIYWEGGENSAEVTVYQKSGKFRMIETQRGGTKNTLISDGTVYIWREGSSVVKTTSLEDANAGLLDQYASLIVYEGLLELPKEDILDASHATYEGENCIYVEYLYKEIYTRKLYISVEKNLLIAAEILENGKTVYLMEPDYTDLTAPGDDWFTPPPGS